MSPARLLSLSLVLLTVSFLASPSHATLMRELSRAELVDHADLIVRGHVKSQRSEWTSDQTAIHTLTELEIDEPIKGQSPPTIVIEQIGGQVGDRHLRVAGSGELHVGQEAIVFLRAHEGHYVLTDLAQSVYSVERHGRRATVSRDLNGIVFTSFDGSRTHGPRSQESKAEPLAHLTADIRRAMRGARP